jgi:hypothetical protein
MNGPCAVPAPRCGYCGPGVARHHLLGRDADGKYVQPELLLLLCQPDCHQGGIHRLLTLGALDGPMPATPGVLLGRIACTFRWLAWGSDPAPVTLSGEQLRAIGDVLETIGRELRRAEGSGA